MEKGANISVANNGGDTGFLLAAEANLVDVVAMLLEKKASIDQRDIGDNTALMRTIRKADSIEALGVAKLLVEKKANVGLVNNINGENALIAATKKGFFDLVLQILETKQNIDVYDKYGSTPLLLACENKFRALAEEFVKRNADVNATNYDLNTALICASRSGDADLVKLLLDHNADAEAINANGETPLICAADGDDAGLLVIIDMLIGKKVNLDCVDSSGKFTLLTMDFLYLFMILKAIPL